MTFETATLGDGVYQNFRVRLIGENDWGGGEAGGYDKNQREDWRCVCRRKQGRDDSRNPLSLVAGADNFD